MTTLKRRYIEHRFNAKARGIEFCLTFEEWKRLWVESGKLDQRGARRGQYVMARHGDQGPYAIGNVRICIVGDNHREYITRRGPAMFGERNAATGKNYWATMSPEDRAARLAATSARFKGKPKSLATRAAMSKAATGRRKVIIDGRPAWAKGEAHAPDETEA